MRECWNNDGSDFYEYFENECAATGQGVFCGAESIQCGSADVCVSNAGMTTCAQPCSDDSECSSGTCTATGVCVPEQGYFDYEGIPCDSPERARADGTVCVDQAWCNLICGADGSCPEGQTCVNAGDSDICAIRIPALRTARKMPMLR